MEQNVLEIIDKSRKSNLRLLKLFPWYQPTSQKLTTPSYNSLSKMELKSFCVEPPRHNKAWERRLRPLIAFMLSPGPKTQMEPQEVQIGQKAVIFGNPEGPQNSLLETWATIPPSKEKGYYKGRHTGSLICLLLKASRREGPGLQKRKVVDSTCFVGFLQTHSQRFKGLWSLSLPFSDSAA